MQHNYLSHDFSKCLPVFGDQIKFDVRQLRSISVGDSSNAFSAELQSHWGTHVDAPSHFFANGKSISAYPAGYFVFSAPEVFEVSLQSSEILRLLEPMENISKECDLLLLKSGWGAFRGQSRYCRENPGIAPELARLLRAQFPHLRAMGIDWISISAFSNRELGREAHRAFLDPAGDNNPLLLIEDMDLSAELRGLRRVVVAPLRIKDFDSAPCTVLGEWDD